MPKDGAATKALLVDTYVDMMQGSDGEITVKSLVEKAGVNRQTFYYHFETLDQFVAYACETKVRQAYSSSVAHRDSDNGFELLAEFVFEHREAARRLLESKGRHWIRRLLYEESVSLCRERIERYLRDCDGISEQDRLASATYCTLASASIIESWVTGEVSGTPREIAAALEAGLARQARGLVRL